MLSDACVANLGGRPGTLWNLQRGGDDAVRCDGQRRPLEELTRAELPLLVEAAFPAFRAAAAANAQAESTSDLVDII